MDCRQSPAGGDCTVAIEADDRDELMTTVMEHAKTVHGFPDNDETRNSLTSLIQPVANA